MIALNSNCITRCSKRHGQKMKSGNTVSKIYEPPINARLESNWFTKLILAIVFIHVLLADADARKQMQKRIGYSCHKYSKTQSDVRTTPLMDSKMNTFGTGQEIAQTTANRAVQHSERRWIRMERYRGYQ